MKQIDRVRVEIKLIFKIKYYVIYIYQILFDFNIYVTENLIVAIDDTSIVQTVELSTFSSRSENLKFVKHYHNGDYIRNKSHCRNKCDVSRELVKTRLNSEVFGLIDSTVASEKLISDIFIRRRYCRRCNCNCQLVIGKLERETRNAMQWI